MDFLPDKEFHPVFDRVSRSISLKGADSPAEVNKRLLKRRKTYRERMKEKKTSVKMRKRLRFKRKELRKLILAGFGRRTVDEAIENPRGKVALTLQYGHKKAKEILLKRARRRIRR